MTEKEYNKTVELLSKLRFGYSEDTIKKLVELNHMFQNANVINMLNLGLVNSIRSKIGYDVIKHVYDKCEFYNTLADRSEIWETMEAYLKGNAMSPSQKATFKNVIVPGLMRYARDFDTDFNDFYAKCKEAGYLED